MDIGSQEMVCFTQLQIFVDKTICRYVFDKIDIHLLHLAMQTITNREGILPVRFPLQSGSWLKTFVFVQAEILHIESKVEGEVTVPLPGIGQVGREQTGITVSFIEIVFRQRFIESLRLTHPQVKEIFRVGYTHLTGKLIAESFLQGGQEGSLLVLLPHNGIRTQILTRLEVIVEVNVEILVIPIILEVGIGRSRIPVPTLPQIDAMRETADKHGLARFQIFLVVEGFAILFIYNVVPILIFQSQAKNREGPRLFGRKIEFEIDILKVCLISIYRQQADLPRQGSESITIVDQIRGTAFSDRTFAGALQTQGSDL